ncbi:MAG: dienelactone hydrolase family protein [Candidatus Aquilonibacter sp.]
MIDFTRPDGKKAPGYYAPPPGGGTSAPGVVMLEEWWGVTDHIKKTADTLAAAGFRVLVPDLYRGRTAAVGDEANHLMEGLDFGDAATQDARGGAQYLLATGSKKVGVIGFCMGGALTFLAAMYDPEFSAAVSFYGYAPPEAGDVGQIKIPIQGHWAVHDEHFKLDGVDMIEARLDQAQVPHEFHRYHAEHAFHNPNQPGNSGLGHYNEELAKLAWSRSVDFLKSNLAA